MRAVMNHQKGKVETASRQDEDRDLCEVFSSLFAEEGHVDFKLYIYGRN